MTLVLRYVARSDRGLVRSINEDSVYAGPRLLAVADGMGGHAAGEVASKVVIAALASLDDDEPGEDLLGQLREAVQTGNGAIAELVAGDPDLDGMGTTLTAILFSGNKLGLVNVGDSRTYLMRGGNLNQITHDDTFIQSLIDEGRITEQEAANHPQRSLLLRALTGHDVEPTLTVREARPGDRYLLCSDGLSSFVSHETLAEAIRIPDPQACADRMIELALKAGGADNVTVIVADVVDVDFGDDAPIVGGAAGDGSDDPPPADSPASRARALNPQPAHGHQERQDDRIDPRPRRRKHFRMLMIVVGALALLAAAGFATRYWVMQQYYVGIGRGGEVAIFRGVHGSVLGVSLQRQVEGSCAPRVQNCERRTVDDFKPSAQSTLNSGVPRDSITDARLYIMQLRAEQMLPLCEAATSTGTSTGSRTGTGSRIPGASGSDDATAGRPSSRTGSAPKGASGTASRNGADRAGRPGGRPTKSSTATVPPTPPQRPKVDCREEH
ncbi:MAG: PP2C family protein-serine/threonine phosphatase [Sciscionella sp.]